MLLMHGVTLTTINKFNLWNSDRKASQFAVYTLSLNSKVNRTEPCARETDGLTVV